MVISSRAPIGRSECGVCAKLATYAPGYRSGRAFVPAWHPGGVALATVGHPFTEIRLLPPRAVALGQLGGIAALTETVAVTTASKFLFSTALSAWGEPAFQRRALTTHVAVEIGVGQGSLSSTRTTGFQGLFFRIGLREFLVPLQLQIRECCREPFSPQATFDRVEPATTAGTWFELFHLIPSHQGECCPAPNRQAPTHKHRDPAQRRAAHPPRSLIASRRDSALRRPIR
jgi:hypothetical protein